MAVSTPFSAACLAAAVTLRCKKHFFRSLLVVHPEDWLWRSFRHYLTGEDGIVEIESHWTAKRREQLGIYPTVRITAPGAGPPFR